MQALAGQQVIKISIFISLFYILIILYIDINKHALFFFQFNVSHRIRHLSFGDEYPGIVNPLDETEQIADQSKFTELNQ